MKYPKDGDECQKLNQNCVMSYLNDPYKNWQEKLAKNWEGGAVKCI